MKELSILDRLFLGLKKVGNATLVGEKPNKKLFLFYVIIQAPTILYMFIFNFITKTIGTIAKFATKDGDKKLKAFFDLVYFKNPIMSFILFVAILYYFLKTLM